MINTDVTGAGATLALGLTYFNTDDVIAYEWLSIPQSQYLLEAVRPDLLQLRVSSYSSLYIVLYITFLFLCMHYI